MGDFKGNNIYIQWEHRNSYIHSIDLRFNFGWREEKFGIFALILYQEYAKVPLLNPMENSSLINDVWVQLAGQYIEN